MSDTKCNLLMCRMPDVNTGLECNKLLCKPCGRKHDGCRKHGHGPPPAGHEQVRAIAEAEVDNIQCVPCAGEVCPGPAMKGKEAFNKQLRWLADIQAVMKRDPGRQKIESTDGPDKKYNSQESWLNPEFVKDMWTSVERARWIGLTATDESTWKTQDFPTFYYTTLDGYQCFQHSQPCGPGPSPEV